MWHGKLSVKIPQVESLKCFVANQPSVTNESAGKLGVVYGPTWKNVLPWEGTDGEHPNDRVYFKFAAGRNSFDLTQFLELKGPAVKLASQLNFVRSVSNSLTGVHYFGIESSHLHSGVSAQVASSGKSIDLTKLRFVVNSDAIDLEKKLDFGESQS